MEQKALIAIVAAAVVVAAAAGIAVFALGGDDNTDDKDTLVIKEAGTYTGTFKSVVIDPAVGDGTVTLNGVVINGDLKINGGGSHSIILTNCEINGDTVVAKEGGETPRIYADGTNVSNIVANCDVILESANGASFSQVNAEGKEITIQGNNTSVEKVTVTGGKLTITDATVDEVNVSGTVELDIPAGTVSSVTVTGNADITGNVEVPIITDSPDNVIKVDGVEKHAHYMIEAEPAVAATCTSAGHAAHYKCSGFDTCGFDYPAEVIDPLPHKLGDYVSEVPATCTSDGTRGHMECSVCHNLFVLDGNDSVEVTAEDLIIAKLGHNLEHHEAAAATCTDTGNKEYYYCDRCQAYFDDADATIPTDRDSTVISALGHQWGETTYTWTEAGNGYACKASHTCTRADCGTIDSEDAVVTSETVPGATCTDKVKIVYTATFTRFDKDTKTVDGTEGSHDLIDKEGKAATCTVSGWKAYQVCSRCDYTTFETIDALGHHLVHVEAAEPSIGHDGHNEYDYCDRDGCDYTTKEIIPALRGINIYVYGGTPSAEGYTYDVPEGMGSVKHLGVPQNTAVTITYDAAAGKTFMEWSDDRYDYIGVETFTILAEMDCYILADYNETMTFGNWVIVSVPDCEDEGLAYRETADGLRQYVVLYPGEDRWDGHSPTNIRTIHPATCTEDGLAEATCSKCGATYQYAIPATGHKLDGGKIILEASGKIVGQIEFTCTNDGCDHKEYKNYVSPIYPSENIQLNITDYYNYYTNGNYEENHTIFKTEDGKDAYVYAITGERFRDDDHDRIFMIFAWIDEGAHSPIYIQRGTLSTYNTTYKGWGIIGYADNIEDFQEYLEDTHKGYDNGRTNSGFHFLMGEFAEKYNAYNDYWHFVESYERDGKTYSVYVDTEDTSYGGYDSVIIDEYYCTYSWVHYGTNNNLNNFYINTLAPAASVGVTIGGSIKGTTLTYNPYTIVSQITARENITYYQENHYQGAWLVTDSYMPNDEYKYYSMRDVTLPFCLNHKDLEHKVFDHFEIEGIDGNWYYLTNSDSTTINIDGKSCKSVIQVFEALSDKYGTDVFVKVTDPKFNNIHLRAIYNDMEPDCTLAAINSMIDINGDRTATAKTFSGRSIYVYASPVPGKEVIGWNVAYNGGDAEFNDYSSNSYYYYLVKAGNYTFEPVYEELTEKSVTISVIGDGFVYMDGSIFADKAVTVTKESLLNLQSINGIGYHFLGWKVEYENEGEYDLEPMAFGDGEGDGEDYGYLIEQALNRFNMDGVVKITAIFVEDMKHFDSDITGGYIMDPNYKIGLGEGYKLSHIRSYVGSQYDYILYLFDDPNGEPAARWDVTVDGETERITVSKGYTYVQITACTSFKAVEQKDVVKYNLTFIGNGNTEGSMEAMVLEEQYNHIRIPANKFVKEGFDFVKWTDQYGVEYTDEQIFEFTKDTVLTAQWAPKTGSVYLAIKDVNYYFYGFKNGNSLGTTYGEDTVIPAASDLLSKIYGFTITGWKDNDGNIYAADGTATVTYPLGRLEAIIDLWEIDVEFDSNGAPGTMDSIHIVFDGKQYYELPDSTVYLERLGYNQGGWMFDAEDSSNYIRYVDELEMIKVFSQGYKDGDTVTLYAKWDVLTYRISYNKNLYGAEGALYSNPQFTIETTTVNNFGFTSNFSKSGYTVNSKWNTRADGSGFSYESNAVMDYQEIIRNHVSEGNTGTYIYLYVQWNGPAIVYDNGGTDNDYSCNMFTVGDEFDYKVTSNQPYKQGYSFVGWSLTADGDVLKSTDIITEEMQDDNGNIRLYPIWKPKSE